MINFILKRVLKKIKKQKKLYFLVVIQFAVGFLILNTFISTSVSINNKYNQLIQEAKQKEFNITAKYKDDTYFNRDKFVLIDWGKKEPMLNEYKILPFESCDLNILQREFTNVKFSINSVINILYLGGEEGETYKVYYSSLYDSVKVSSGFLKMLNNMNAQNTVNPRDFPHSFIDNKFVAVNGLKYRVNVIENNENIIYIPIEAYYDIYHPKDLTGISLNIQILGDKVSCSKLLSKIYDELNKRHGDTFTYSIESEFARFLTHVDRAREEAMAFNFIAGTILVIVLIGLSGLFILIIDRRKKEIAICLALGEDKGVVYLEIILEMCIVAFLGSILGIIAGQLLLVRGFEIATVVIYPNLLVAFWLVILSLFIVAISTIPVFINIKKLMPLEIFRTM